MTRQLLLPRMSASLAAGCLLLEVWLFKQRFSTDLLVESPTWWAPLVRALRFNTPWGLCTLAAILLIGHKRILAAYRAEAGEMAHPRERMPWILGHVLALVLFYLVTARLLEGHLAQGFIATTLPILWLASGTAAILLLGAVSLPLASLARVVKRSSWAILGGLAVGSAAFAIGAVLNETWPLWEPLARSTLWASDRMLALFVADRIYEPSGLILGTEAFPVHVTQYCSGYEGIGLFLVFFSVFLALSRERLRFPNALVLLPLGICAAWFLNTVRIAVLIVIGTFISPAVAIDGFHVFAGWPLVCCVALGCVALGTRSSYFAAGPPASSTLEATGTNPTAVYLAPLLVWTAVALVVGAFSSSPADLYAVRLAPVFLVLWVHRREHLHLRPEWSLPAVGFGVAAFLAWAGLVHALPSGSARAWGGDELGGQDLARSWSALWWTIRITGTCVAVPLVEELAFRGYLMRRLVAADFERVRPEAVTWASCLLSSLAFGLLHRSWPAGAAAGMIFALAYRRRGRLFDAVLAHSVTNGLVVIFALAAGDRQLWG